MGSFMKIPGTHPVGALLPSLGLSLDSAASVFGAYSLHQLRTAYAGKAVKVRNAAGALLDIGFVSGELDTNALLTHAGGGDAWVDTWYDQSGNARDLTAPAGTAAQPKIINAGALYLMDGRPAVYAGGAANLYKAATVFGPQDKITTVSLIQPDAGANTGTVTVFGAALAATYSYEPLRISGTTAARFDSKLAAPTDQVNAAGAVSPGVTQLFSTTDNLGAVTLAKNASVVAQGTITKSAANNPNRFGVFARSSGSAYYVGRAETFIAYIDLVDIGNVLADLAYRHNINIV